MKKIFSFILAILFLIICTSCEIDNNEYLVLPDLTGMSRSEISQRLDNLGIDYIFKFSDQIIYSDDELDKFVCYNGDYKIGSKISPSYQVYVYTTVLPLDYYIHDEVKLTVDYTNKSFTKDGIGVVTLARSIDGDTAHFYCDGEYIKVRFLGIDTPESTFEKDPWGKAASNYTASILNNAETIVLESEGSLTDTYGRYLAFVWADGMLLNLNLVEEAYTNSTLSNSKYAAYFLDAQKHAKATGRRFYGETDPNYDYERKTFK